MSVIQTYTGQAFNLFNPAQASILIEDIAHALSQITRFTGHGNRFYSVAEHCVHVATLVPNEYKLSALLHDASEAYLSDLSSPLKHDIALCGYRQIEEDLEHSINTRFGTRKHPAIKIADRQMLAVEAESLLSKPLIPEWNRLISQIDSIPNIRIKCWPSIVAKSKFLSRYKQYAML